MRHLSIYLKLRVVFLEFLYRHLILFVELSKLVTRLGNWNVYKYLFKEWNVICRYIFFAVNSVNKYVNTNTQPKSKHLLCVET